MMIRMSQDFAELQKELAKIEKEYKPREKIKEDVEKQLRPLFTKFYPSSKQYKLYKKYEKKLLEKFRRITEFLDRHTKFVEIFSEGVSKENKTDKNKHLNFVLATTYLLQVELIGNVIVDQTLLLLIGSGCDFHLEPDYKHRYTRHATSLEDLEKPFLPLSIKLDFLSSNGLPLFSKWIDRNLRNKIAHLDYEISENGDFYIKGSKKPINLCDKIQLFTEYYFCVMKVFLEERARITKKK